MAIRFCALIGVGAVSAFLIQAQAQYRDIKPDWSFTIGAISDSSPALGPDGTIYFGAFDGRFWALNSNGSKKWMFRTGSEIKSSPALGSDGTLYFGCRDRKFYAVAADGKKRWDFVTGGWVDSSPALAKDGTIYVGSWDKNFYAFNPDGSKKWQFQTGGEIVSSPSIGGDGRIYFGSDDRKFYALDIDGKKRWDYETGGAIISSPAINGDECVYFTSTDGYFYALNFDGKLRWRLRTGGIGESSAVITEDGTIYVGVNFAIWAITTDGKQKWPRPMDDSVEASPIALSDKSVCFVCRTGALIAVGPERDLLWGHFCDGYGYATPAVSTTGTLYLPEKGNLFSALPAGVPLAKSHWPKFRGNARNTGNISDRER
jgi:outer membrane protein assembly factor BamB